MKYKNEKVYASFSQRLLAHNIDLVPILLLFYLTSLLSKTPFHYLILFGIYVAYHSIFELSNWQGSPGKTWTKLKVVSESANSNGLFAILLRNSCKIFSLLLLFGGFTMIAFHPKKQGLHDLIAGTFVLFGED
ncbi:MAG: RDD family protein [Bacteroidota bacterium]